ncbi:MAG TPA: DNA-processing protein DprA, partial [Solirubrobacteraceae bacterium]
IGRPAVAFLDAPEASDYGRAMAASLARGLAAAGVTIVAGVRGPLGRAVHAVASRAGTSLAVLGEGLATVRGRAEATLRLVLDGGCAVSELPWRSAARKWGPVACERIVTGLGAATVVVESRGEERELWAGRLGGPLGAVPGMVTNPLACGPHRLLAGGARLLREPSEVLELLYEAGASPLVAAPIAPDPCLPPRVRGVLELVGAGIDTPEGLAAAATEGRLPGYSDRGRPLEVMAALGELEAIGALSRTEEGRYVRRDPARDHWL